MAARRELAEAVRYYNAERTGLGNEFRDKAWEAVERIKTFPTAWQALDGSIRRCQLERFPYGLIYSVRRTEIVIIAVAHLHREPQYWRSRIN
ncbi:type II toxin-antitoxin system RelE/ParE family toxin [uncultured Thiodictyon sp.]|uniref:type II toxin-antitoxin system RelE/ParE family toxin n=1 Tax=uncultured Thiodictyon sp. TaxID=1846217 RepID=UPI0034522ACD